MSDNNNNNNNNPESAAKKRKANGTEPSPRGKKLTHDLLTSLDDPDLCDVTLVGSDGGRVPAVRAYLSARSDVLKRLLVGRFKEASEEEVRMDYPSAVIEALVYFCCTDDVPKLLELGDGNLAESLRLSVKLLSAADYYGLDSLKDKTVQSIKEFTKGDKNLKGLQTCVLLQETSTSLSLKKHYSSMIYTIRKKPDYLLPRGGSQPAGVTFLSSDNLFKIFDDNQLCACAWILFRAVKIWLEEGTYEEGMSPEDRHEFAKKCCAKLELRMIPPKILLGAVSDSGLVDQNSIYQALQKQVKGGAIGLYGAGLVSVNGVYEEVPINDNFGVAAEGQETTYDNIRRFDKVGQLDGLHTTFSILFLRSTSLTNENSSSSWSLVAPPCGAGSLVLAGDLKQIVQDNRYLYSAELKGRFSFDPNVVIDSIQWKAAKEPTAKDPAPKMKYGAHFNQMEADEYFFL